MIEELTAANLVEIALLLHADDRARRQNVPIPSRPKPVADYFDEAYALIEQADTYLTVQWENQSKR